MTYNFCFHAIRNTTNICQPVSSTIMPSAVIRFNYFTIFNNFINFTNAELIIMLIALCLLTSFKCDHPCLLSVSSRPHDTISIYSELA